MPYWVFHQAMLDKQLLAYRAERIGQGATPEEADAEAKLILAFLLSPAGAPLLGGQ